MTGSTLFTHLSKRLLRGAALLSLLCAMGTVAAHAQSASTWNKRGLDAEAREDWDTAFNAYHQAWLKKPKDMRYKVRMEAVKVNAAAMHVDRGRVLRQNGDDAGALGEFMRALEIDPSDQVAEQEIALTEHKDQQPAGTGPQAGASPGPNTPSYPASAISAQANREMADLGSPVQLKPTSDDIVSLHMVEDVKNIYQAIGKMCGINVLFDPDYNSKRVPIDLTNVSLYDALRIVGTISGTFWKPVTPNTIFVAQNTRNKHQDLDDMGLQTFYLTNVSSQADANELQTAIRSILDPAAKIYLVQSQNALVLRAPPDELLLAQKMLKDLDRPKPEVVVDIAILEVNRDKIRNLGITLPQSFGLTPQSSNATTTTNNSSTNSSTTNSTGTSTTTSNLSLNDLAHFNATNFGVTVSGATLNALLNDTDTRVLQNPRVRATDGQRAVLKIGEKIPVATGSYNAGVSTGVASIGVQTQFTYQDVGVNIDMTPTVHYDHEITLKMTMEVTTEAGQVTISGVTEPIIGQRHAEQVVQLKEGEPSILAGLLDQEDNRTNSGTPGLAQIPILKYIFGSQYHENKRDEIVFVLVPHIVRESVISSFDTRPIDTGTSQDIQLRHTGDVMPVPDNRAVDLPAPATTAASAANAMVGQFNRPVTGTAPTTAAAAASAMTAAPVTFSVVPPTSSQAVGSTFQVAIMASGARDLSSVPLTLQFDPRVLTLVNASTGDLLSRDGQATSLARNEPSPGMVTLDTSRPSNSGGVSGQGSICVLTFRASAPGDSTVSLVKVGATNAQKVSQPAVGGQAVVHVTASAPAH